MRYETRVERIGEWLGPVDFSYDFAKHGWGNGRGGINPGRVPPSIEMMRKLSAQPDGWLYSPSDFSAFPVVNVGMYDGWPFWEPTPAIGYVGPLGSVEVAFFYDLSEHKLSRAKEKP